jgi:hypothetical protein
MNRDVAGIGYYAIDPREERSQHRALGHVVTGAGWGVTTVGSDTFRYQGLTTYLSYSGGYTAEWIVEDYGNASGGLVRFADYRTETFRT